MKVFNKQKHTVKGLLGTDSNKLICLENDLFDTISTEQNLLVEWDKHASNLFGETRIVRRHSFKAFRGFLGVGSHLKKPTLVCLFNELKKEHSSNSRDYFNIKQKTLVQKKFVLKKIKKLLFYSHEEDFSYEYENEDYEDEDRVVSLISDYMLNKEKDEEYEYEGETLYDILKKKSKLGKKRNNFLFREISHNFFIEKDSDWGSHNIDESEERG
jgi:hypothetical protein